MISYLKGTFAHITPSTAIVDIGGIGYEVNISLNTYSKIQNLEKGLLYTHVIIKEDAHLLYGFSDTQEKDIFLLLISVSGIGANTARLILSYMKPEEIVAAITRGDAGSLERIKGIGKKTAERAILELKDKLGKGAPDTGFEPSKGTGSTLRQDALSALQSLGINRNQAEQAVQKITAQQPDIVLEQLIKEALKAI